MTRTGWKDKQLFFLACGRRSTFQFSSKTMDLSNVSYAPESMWFSNKASFKSFLTLNLATLNILTVAKHRYKILNEIQLPQCYTSVYNLNF